MPKPAPTHQRQITYVTPDLGDLFFWEYVTLSREDETDLENSSKYAYGTAHPDSDKYPGHELVFLQHDPMHGQPGQDSKRYRAYYAAVRADEDEYNFSSVQADIGGQKFNAVSRTYIVKRATYDPDSPAQGAALADVPASKFDGTYVLAGRVQKRTGEKELDSLYVVEERTYVEKVTITTQGYDEATDGVLSKSVTLYYRGETYTPALTTIETAAASTAWWGVDANGILTEVDQLTDNWWAVTNQDVIPQDKDTTDNKFGGKVLRVYDKYVSMFWPAVLGDDGTGAGTAIEIMDWVDKDGGSRNYPRPLFEEQAYRGPTRVTITEEWVQVLPDISASANRPIALQPKPIVYNSPYLSISIPPTLHDAMTIVCDTSSSDPTWGANVGSSRTFPATEHTVWPDSYTADVNFNIFRGGYLIRHVEAFKPETTT